MQHHAAPRFTHAFVIYDADVLPDAYRGKMYSVSPLHGRVVESRLSPKGSTFRTEDIGYLFQSRDSWCRPVDIQVGPDGCIYVADFYEQRIDHASHYQGRVHRSSGRILRIRPRQLPSQQPTDRVISNDQLLRWQQHPNKWYRQTALRLIGDRKDPALIAPLTEVFRQNTGQHALEALWALNLTVGWHDELAVEAMRHRDAWVRAWRYD